MKILFQRYLAAPPRVVWPYISQPEHMAEWSEAPIRALQAGKGDSPGDRRAIKVGPGMTVLEEILVAEPPSRLEYRVVKGGGMRNHHGTITLQPAGAGTLLEWNIQFGAILPGLDRLIGALLDPPFQRSLDVLTRVARAAARASA